VSATQILLWGPYKKLETSGKDNTSPDNYRQISIVMHNS